MSLKIVFMGTPEFSVPVLQSLNNSKHQLLTVYTQPPKKKSRGQKIIQCPIHKAAERLNISVRFPERISSKEEVNFIKKLKPDIVIVVAYGKILPNELLALSNIKFINIHASLLPRWRGAAPIEHTLLAGDVKTGISIISISPKLDAGDILMQESFQLDKDINSGDLTLNLTNLGKKILMKTLPLLFEKKLIGKKQDETKVTYANKFTSEDRKINFYNSADDVFNHIRAHGPKPGSWFTYKGERIKIIKAKKTNQLGESSTILDKDFTIACKEGAILPLFIQREGKKVVSLEDFLRGFTFSVHDKLNA